jgi:hypothetical protein
MSDAVMSCERSLAVLTADVGEVSGDERARARLHASKCPRCSSAYDTGSTDVGLPRSAHSPPEAAAPLRVGLAIIAGVQLALAGPWLLGHSIVPDAHVAVAHLTRDGALGLVMGALGLVTAWRPRYVHSTILIGLLVGAAQLVSALTDQHTSPARPSFELDHLLVVLILLGQFAIAINLARRATPTRGPTAPILRTR